MAKRRRLVTADSGLLLRYRYVILNLLAVALLWAYFQYMHDDFLARLKAVYDTHQPDVALALIILAMYPLETIGLLLRLPSFRHNTENNTNPSWWGLVFGGFLLLGLLFVNALPGVFLSSALGLSDDLELPNVLLLLLIIVGWSLPTAFLGGQFEKVSDIQTAIAKSPQRKKVFTPLSLTYRGLVRESLGDLMLTLYGAMALTTSWDLMVANSETTNYPPFVLAFLFMMFVFLYSSSRAVFAMEELFTCQPWYVRAISLGSMWLIGIQALMQL